MSVYNSLSSTSYIVSLCVFFLYLFFHGLFFFNMDVGSFLRKLFGEPVRGANIFLFGPNKLHTTTPPPLFAVITNFIIPVEIFPHGLMDGSLTNDGGPMILESSSSLRNGNVHFGNLQVEISVMHKWKFSRA